MQCLGNLQSTHRRPSRLVLGASTSPPQFSCSWWVDLALSRCRPRTQLQVSLEGRGEGPLLAETGVPDPELPAGRKISLTWSLSRLSQLSMACGGSWLPSISRAACGRQLEKIREEGDVRVTKAERRYSGTRDDLPESKGRSVNATYPSRGASPSPSAGTGWTGSEPPGLLGACAQLATAVQPSRKSSSSSCSSCSSSSHSHQSPEALVLEVHNAQQPEEFSLVRLQTKDGQRPEWTFYPRFSSNIHTYHVGKQCFFNGVFLGNRRSVSEWTVDKRLGRKRYDIDPRNGIPKSAPGDNPYMSPEQSKGFYHAGSTLPPVNFSLVPYQKKFDTFIPLEPLPTTPSLPFWVKEKANHLKNEIREVEELDNWQPAAPLVRGLFPSGVDLPRQT
ncbi:PREDICTED: spermatogenesis-associated serine-rich protein 1 isoform X2 [Chinchilla lanigera]|uniref:spermatogenesis-associated serine-rich protein 1 isoform X2 n=1 Tax=Chinchilla lanigera TaxID=34839 RepID=UPI000698B4A2|nr:PREDICTED: spermatogenesis-associated serine-rich protein 1 isoform X2 [Chinchilla lanigera]